MMPLELLELCEKQLAEHSLEFLVLTVPYRRHLKRRIRLLPGVLAEVVGSDPVHRRMMCSVKIADVRRYFVKHLSALEGHAVRLAEDGNHEEAARWFAQYEAIRDRLAPAGMWRSRV